MSNGGKYMKIKYDPILGKFKKAEVEGSGSALPADLQSQAILANTKTKIEHGLGRIVKPYVCLDASGDEVDYEITGVTINEFYIEATVAFTVYWR